MAGFIPGFMGYRKKPGFMPPKKIIAIYIYVYGVALSASRDGVICNPYAPALSKLTFPISYVF